MNPFDAIASYYDLEHNGLTFDTTMYSTLCGRRQSDILVLGCGTGRVIAPLLSMRNRVVGVDASGEMLARAGVRLGSNDGLTLVSADIRDVDLGRSFDVIILPLDTFSLLTDQQSQVDALLTVRRHLREGACFVMDVTNPLQFPDVEDNGIERRRFDVFDGDDHVVAFDSVEVDPADQSMTMSIRYEVEREVSDRYSQTVMVDLRWVYRWELAALFQLAGLSNPKVYGNYDLEPYGYESPRLIASTVDLTRRP